MSLTEPPSRRPAPYAALEPDPQPAADYAAEAGRLEALKRALWDAFQSAPAAIPVPLIDLAATYASTLRLQLSLIAASPRRRPVPRPVSGARPEMRS